MVSEENPDVEMTEEPVLVPTASTLEEVPWEQWADDGEAKFLAAFAHLIKADKPEKDLDCTLKGFSKALHQLVSKGIYGPLTTEQVSSVINRVLFWNVEIPSVVVDVLSVIDMDANSFEVEAKKKFNQLCKAIAKIVPVKLFKERYEMEPLTDLDILPSKNFPSKFIKVKTRLYYKQNKFNLLREETEGFSKLMVCLFNQRISDDGGLSVEESKNVILSLCGWFSLDPGRVLDLILDVFECNVSNHNFFVPLVKEFVKDSEMLFEVLIFRYSLYFKDGITPSSLHTIVAHFINNDLISFDEIYKELEPSEEEIYSEIEKGYNTAETKTVSLTKKNTEEETPEQEFEAHQKFGLIEVLIANGRWDLFFPIINNINCEYFLQQQPIAVATTSFVHYLIDPLYNKYSTLGPKANKVKLPHYQNCKLKPVNTLKEFVDRIVPILELLGPSIHHDSVLMFKIIRLLISVKYKLNDISEPELGDFECVILKLIECSLLPALSHLESNCCVAEVIWDLLRSYPVAIRYCAYANWKEYSSKCPTILKRKPLTSYLIRNCLKKVSKENVKPMGRIMGKISHYAPIDLFEYVMFQIQMYDSLIIPIVESLKFVNGMAYDVLGFVLVEALRNDPNKRPKHDGNAPTPWFINTAVFCASIMKKYSIDITGILKYIVEELLNKNYIELVVLKEILQKMTGIEITDEMTDDQIDALGGGECLRGEAAYFVPLRSMKRSTNRLKDALIQEDLFATTSILIAQLKYNIVYEEEQDFHLKFLGKLYDECHDTLLQYGTFISGATMDDYNVDFPNLETLVLDYHITHECAFFLCRHFLIHKAKLKAAITSSERNHKMDTSQINGNVDDDENDAEIKINNSDKNETDGGEKIVKKENEGRIMTNLLDSDTLSCISSEDLDEPLEEDTWNNVEDNSDIHSVNEDDSCNDLKKVATISEIYNMEICEETKANFEWDALDNKTWIQHNGENSPLTNNKILEYRDEIEHPDYFEDEEDLITGTNVFDIPKIFNIPPEGEGCLIEPMCLKIPEDSECFTEDLELKPEVHSNTEDSIIILDDDVASEDKSKNEKQASNTSNENKQDEQNKVEENGDNVDSNLEADDEDRDKSNSKGGSSSKLVNILLDWVIPSVLTIQDATSFISEEISPYASAIFWTLTLYDIYAPVDLYDKEVSKLKSVLSNQDHSKDNSSKAKKEIEKVNLLIERLMYEKKRHVKHVKSVMKKLEETKNEWFAAQTHKNAKNELINVLLHSCILPRVLFSAMDAVYCAKFILTLHQLHIENFSTVLCYDRLLCDIKNLVAMCSENEASRFGRFLCAVLKDVMRFHSSQEIYNEECANTPGFITKFRSSFEHIDPSDQVHYENYRHLCHKWHYKITKALLCLLDSKEYILIRNTIIVLKKILPQFPVIMKLAQCIEKKIGKIKQEEKDMRQDLHTLATSYWGHLKTRMPNMIDEGQFHLIETNDKDSEKETKEKDKSKKDEKSDKEKEDKEGADKHSEKEDDEEFPLSKSDNESSSKKSVKKDKGDENSKDESKVKATDKRSARSSSRASTRGKRPHSEAVKKSDASRSSEDARKTARKKHKSRSKSIEPEQNSKKEVVKKSKAKREYASPEPKKSRKKERKASSKSKTHHESPEQSPDRKHKPQQKTKRN